MSEKHPLQLAFIDSHAPGMPDGDYRITVQQSLSITANSNELPAEDATRYLYVSVAGPRFSLDPSLVKSVFPPDKGIGRYTNVLPHIVFDRSTLPWERKIDSSETYAGATWLALLMFTEDEIDTYNISSQSMSLSDLQNGSTNPEFPSFSLESSQTLSDQTLVIDVPLSLLKTVVPPITDLNLLAHVRELTTENAPSASGEDHLFPIVVCNRLPVKETPPAGREVVMYLVSLEGRTDIFDQFSSPTMPDDTLYRLVTLYTWRYATLPENKSFTDYVTDAACQFQGGNTDNMLRLDLVDGEDANSVTLANDLLGAGFVPLPHQTRQGNQIVSWYRSPFVPGAVENLPSPEEFAGTSSADQLVRYFSQVGMLDTSYAAAWQLGQLLTLQNTSVSMALYNWKHAQAILNSNQTKAYLPLKRKRTASFPESAMTWLKSLSLFEHVPFNYLVPDEQMLPSESMRFFKVDPLWRAALIDGAFSVGRVLTADGASDQPHIKTIMPSLGGMEVSGFLLRSHVVEGWPRMQIEAYASLPPSDDNTCPDFATPSTLLRMERLAADILLCLFEGNIQTVDLHEVPETIHFGVTYDPEEGYSVCDTTESPSGWYKAYRFPADATEYTDCYVDAAPYLNFSTGVLQIQPLAEALQSLGEQVDTAATSAADTHSWWVAFQMIEGVQKVRLFVTGT